MRRQDLLVLSEDDLIAQSNRGIVNRQAKRDLEKLTYDISEDENGIVTVTWSDGEIIILPPEKTLLDVTQEKDPIAQRLSREVVRSVLAYQIWAEEQHDPDSSKPLIRTDVWNPADILDEDLIAHYGKAKITRIRTDYNSGHVIELVKSIKPTARIHTLACTVRFLVAGDFRYTHCDCEETAPCSHVPMAIWAFRELATEQQSAIIETHKDTLETPEKLFADLNAALFDFAELGLSGVTDALLRRIERLAGRCEDDGLIWIGAILRDLLTVAAQYTAHDAQFSPIQLAEYFGELLIRMQAIRSQPESIPALFVRGSQSDRETRIGSSTLIGLGCGVAIQQKGVTLSAYLQDTASGQVFAVQKYYADPDTKKSMRPFWKLGNNKAMRGLPFEQVGSQRILVKGGKRQANAVFNAGRAQVSANPQGYHWENLHAPLLAEDFAEIFARRTAQPPASLRPRRIGEDFYVCPVTQVEHVQFDSYSQAVYAVLNDVTGAQANLIHPYTARGADGTENLLWWLQHHSQNIRYIAGQVEVNRGGLVFHPVALVFEVNGARHMLQPWIDRFRESISDAEKLPDLPEAGILRTDPIFYFPSQVAEIIGELLLNGLMRLDDALIRRWEHIVNEGEQLGFDRLLAPLTELEATLTSKRNSLTWDWRIAAQQLFDIALMIQFTREQASTI